MEDESFKQYGLLVLCIAIPLLAGLIGSVFTMDSITTWYAHLNKPWITPPDWAFGPVWTVLYILMGIALFLVLKNGIEKPPVWQGTIIFAVQLMANVLWSFLFFGMHSPVLGLIDIVLLIGLIIMTIVAFYRVSKPAAWLLVPYLAWVCVATYLNAMVLVLN
jgi:translocator protein